MTDLAAVRPTIPEFSGLQLAPGDDGYDQARRVFNGMIDRSPALIATCRSAADVAAAIGYARTSDLPVSVYGGGTRSTGRRSSTVGCASTCVDCETWWSTTKGRRRRWVVDAPGASSTQPLRSMAWR